MTLLYPNPERHGPAMTHLISKIRFGSRLRALFVLAAFAIGSFLVAPSTANAAAGCPTTIGPSSSASCVVKLQNALSVRGIPSGRFGSDGKYGGDTKTAVMEYQKLWGLKVDGSAGPKTQAHMAAHVKPHKKITDRLSNRWSERGTIAIVYKIGKRGSPAVSNVARIYLFRDGKLLRTIQARTGGKAWDKRINKWVYKNTPTGAFRVLNEIEKGYSTFYDADMPYFKVFAPNIGFHFSKGYRDSNYGPGNYGSHGCVNIANMADTILVYKSLTVGRNQVLVLYGTG